MNTNIWIPEQQETVKWRGILCTVISCDMGGKCKIKKMSTTRKISKKFLVDVSEIERL